MVSVLECASMPDEQKITPHLWFDTEAKEAAEFYVSVFSQRGSARIKSITTLRNTPSGDTDFVVFELLGQEFMAISAGPLFKFNEAISFIVQCDSQEEIDHYWAKLAADPGAGQCGWIKDKYGLSWQITPRVLGRMLQDKDPAKVARVTGAFLKMKKFDLAALQRAYDGK